MSQKATPTLEAFDFGGLLLEILDHLVRKRGFRWPIQLAVIDRAGQMLLQTRKAEGGPRLHYPEMRGALAFETSLSAPIQLLVVDGQSKAVKATMLETGQWLLG